MQIVNNQDKTVGGLVLNKDSNALAILFECNKENLDQVQTKTATAAVKASKSCRAGLEYRHKQFSNHQHRIVAIIGQGPFVSAVFATMPENQVESRTIMSWNIHQFEEWFSFSVFLTSLVPFLHEEEAKCTKKRRLDAVEDVEEQPDKKKLKLDLLEDVPFYQRNSSDGIFGSYSNQGGKFHLTSLLDSKEFNSSLLETQNSIKTISLHSIVALFKLQGYLGVPKLLAYQCFHQGSLHKYIIDTTDFTEWPQPAMSLKAMIAQSHCCGCISQAMFISWNQHKDSMARSRDQDWESCGFRGDTDNIRGRGARPADSCLDMQAFGLAIVNWSKKFNSEEFLPLAKVLRSTVAFRRFSPEFALKVLDDPHLITHACHPQYSLDMARRWCHEMELNGVVESRLQETARRKRKLTLNIEWLDNITTVVQQGRFTDQSGKEVNVVGKTLKSNVEEGGLLPWCIALEFSAAQWFSGEKYLPTLLDFEIGRIKKAKKREISHVALVFPQYNKAPKHRNIICTAKQLLTAIKTIHQKRLIHSDIAPANVMWDDNDDVVVIDFGSTFWFNHADALSDLNSDAMWRPYGHHGFMPREQVRYPVTDVFSAGRTIEFFANEWKQMTLELKGLIQAMIFDKWYQRISVDEALKRLTQIQFENEIAQTNQTNESNQMKD